MSHNERPAHAHGNYITLSIVSQVNTDVARRSETPTTASLIPTTFESFEIETTNSRMWMTIENNMRMSAPSSRTRPQCRWHRCGSTRWMHSHRSHEADCSPCYLRWILVSMHCNTLQCLLHWATAQKRWRLNISGFCFSCTATHNDAVQPGTCYTFWVCEWWNFQMCRFDAERRHAQYRCTLIWRQLGVAKWQLQQWCGDDASNFQDHQRHCVNADRAMNS